MGHLHPTSRHRRRHRPRRRHRHHGHHRRQRPPHSQHRPQHRRRLPQHLHVVQRRPSRRRPEQRHRPRPHHRQPGHQHRPVADPGQHRRARPARQRDHRQPERHHGGRRFVHQHGQCGADHGPGVVQRLHHGRRPAAAQRGAQYRLGQHQHRPGRPGRGDAEPGADRQAGARGGRGAEQLHRCQQQRPHRRGRQPGGDRYQRVAHRQPEPVGHLQQHGIGPAAGAGHRYRVGRVAHGRADRAAGHGSRRGRAACRRGVCDGRRFRHQQHG
ncbi:hypothetical protein GO293_04917 [Ralstonia solanacearum]|nr:hypothetical protein [Ralstonia solanacearum]